MPDMTYEVRISGQISEDVLEDFGDLHVATTEASTLLSGSLPDQSALLGLLERLRSLGLDVLEIHQVVEGPET